MRKKGWKRLSGIGFAIGLSMGMLTGCGAEKEADYRPEGIQETEATAQKEENHWRETTKAQMFKSGQDGKSLVEENVEIDARILLPGVEQMSVVEVTELEFDEVYKEKVAKCFFPSGEIYYGDPMHLPKKALQAEKEELMGEYSYTIGPEEFVEYAESAQDWKEMSKAFANMEDAAEDYTPVEEYTVKQYLGTYEGRMYELLFAQTAGDDFSNYRREKRVKWTVKNLYEVCPEKFKEQEMLTFSPWMRGNWIENKCELPEEEALQMAKDFVEQLGLDYPVYAYSRPLLWGTAPESVTEESDTAPWGINGYVFYFHLGADGLSFVNYGTEMEYWDFSTYTKANDEMQYSMQAQLRVYVTEQGIIQVIADNPVEITSISEGVNLLPLDTVQGIIREALNNQGEVLRLNSYVTEFNELELIYFRVRDKEKQGEYSYVPVWRLGYVARDNMLYKLSIRNYVLINAIDGSLIGFYDET